MRWLLASLAAMVLLAGCAADEPATSRFKGPLDRALTEAEQAEVRAVTGKDFDIESTLIGCPPEVDPYDCNEHWLRVDGITQARCRAAVDRLEDLAYWRRAPTCDQPDYG